MTLNIIHNQASQYTEIALPGGKGSTTELAKFPVDATANKPHIWKIVLAKRESSGMYPKFPGYERSIMQLSGKTMTLNHEKYGSQKLSPLVPYTYNGAWETERRLIGKGEDFNLFVRSDRYSSSIERIDLKDRKPLSKQLKLHSILWVYQGSIDWECEGKTVELKEGDLFAVQSDEAHEFIMKSKRALAFLISVVEKTRD